MCKVSGGLRTLCAIALWQVNPVHTQCKRMRSAKNNAGSTNIRRAERPVHYGVMYSLSTSNPMHVELRDYNIARLLQKFILFLFQFIYPDEYERVNKWYVAHFPFLITPKTQNWCITISPLTFYYK